MQNKYKVYGYGRRKSRHFGVPMPKEIDSSVFAPSMQGAIALVLAELKGYEVEAIEIHREAAQTLREGTAAVQVITRQKDTIIDAVSNKELTEQISAWRASAKTQLAAQDANETADDTGGVPEPADVTLSVGEGELAA